MIDVQKYASGKDAKEEIQDIIDNGRLMVTEFVEDEIDGKIPEVLRLKREHVLEVLHAMQDVATLLYRSGHKYLYDLSFQIDRETGLFIDRIADWNDPDD